MLDEGGLYRTGLFPIEVRNLEQNPFGNHRHLSLVWTGVSFAEWLFRAKVYLSFYS
jgi:hypothetical protein